jgi:hypothetical protein
MVWCVVEIFVVFVANCEIPCHQINNSKITVGFYLIVKSQTGK